VETTINSDFDHIDRNIYDFENGIEVQLFPIKRILALIIKISEKTSTEP
jgi:hypothetical protein